MTIETWTCEKCGRIVQIGFPCLCLLEDKDLENTTKNPQLDGTAQGKEDLGHD